MDREELGYHEAATRKGLRLHKNENGTWSLGAPPSTEPLRPGRLEPTETFLSGDRMRVGDQEFKRAMTTRELKDYLGIDDPA